MVVERFPSFFHFLDEFSLRINLVINYLTTNTTPCTGGPQVLKWVEL